ncbi:CD166 antigen-like isoform X3 [Clavelina lepadiformis]|uniref:CD166 antigen-like isoform X3 n=1 Tax=Clavelina lepadiformis TaxID=159417 RepID=UPI004043056D
MNAVCLLVLVFAVYSQAQNSFELMLEDVEVAENTDAKIPCSYVATGELVTESPTIKWKVEQGDQLHVIYTFKQDDEAGSGPRSVEGLNRTYSVDDDGALVIPTATLADNKIMGKLNCEVDFGKTGSKNGAIMFSVYAVADTNPIIMLEKDTIFEAGEKMDIGFCETGFGYPEPKITFYRGSESLDKSDGENDALSEFLGDKATTSKGMKTSSKRYLKKLLTKEDDNAQFYCMVTSGGSKPANQQQRNASFPLFRVHYPTDTVTLRASSKTSFVGDQLSLTCDANGNPSPSIILDGQPSTTMNIDVTKNDDGREITCSAQYSQPDVEAIREVYTINVVYTDGVKVSGDGKVNLGGSTTLSCSVNSKPPSTVHWTKNGVVISNSGELMIENAQFNDAGTYECVAENQFNQLKSSDTVDVMVKGIKLKSEPAIELAGEAGEEVQLTCMVSGNPPPQINWVKMSGEESTDLEQQPQASTSGNEYTSILKVGPLTAEMSKAVYECRAGNEVDSVMSRYTLPEMKGGDDGPEIQQASASPTAGIIIGILVALLVIAVIVAVLYNKGIICKKGEKGDENAEDIAVEINKEEPPADADVEAGKPEETPAAAAEKEELLNGNGDP